MDAPQQESPRKLTLAGIPVRAISIGGIETCYDLPTLDLCVDIGRCPPGVENRKRVFLSHGHIDHAGGLPYYVSLRALLGASAPIIYAPAESHEAIAGVLAAWTALQTDSERCKLVAVSPGDEFALKGNTIARAFRAPHRIPALGWVICTRLRKLRPEHVGLGSAELRELIQRGVTVSDEVQRAELCFTGDTRIEVVEREAVVRTSRALVIECTFVGKDVPVAKAKKGGHVHMDEIAERADLFENETIVLTHFSRRHARSEIEAEVQKLPPKLRERVQLIL